MKYIFILRKNKGLVPSRSKMTTINEQNNIMDDDDDISQTNYYVLDISKR